MGDMKELRKTLTDIFKMNMTVRVELFDNTIYYLSRRTSDVGEVREIIEGREIKDIFDNIKMTKEKIAIEKFDRQIFTINTEDILSWEVIR